MSEEMNDKTEVVDMPQAPVIDEVAIAKLEKETAELREKLETQKYLVDVDNKIIDKYFKFIHDKALWKYSEAIGVIQTWDELTQARLESTKTGKFMLNNLALEAMNYFLSLVSGKGLKDAQDYISMIKPLAQALQNAKNELEKLNTLEFNLVSLKEGIALPEESEEVTENAEITA